MEADLRDELRARMRDDLSAGFAAEQEIIDAAVELVSDEVDETAADEVAEAAPTIFREALAEHEQARAAWPAVTDCDRLDAAFDDLNERGILARHHWWCCQTCGHGAMPGERDRTLAEGRPARGYAFYHEQDTEGAVEGGALHLAYGAFGGGDEDQLAIAREVVDVLAAHGLTASWNGSNRTRIAVALTWQRRARPPRWTE